jgi:hypothetical protein
MVSEVHLQMISQLYILYRKIKERKLMVDWEEYGETTMRATT